MFAHINTLVNLLVYKTVSNTVFDILDVRDILDVLRNGSIPSLIRNIWYVDKLT